MNALAGLQSPNIGAGVMESFAGGQAMGERQRLKKALATYSTNPDDPEAMSTIAELEPRLAAQLHEERLAQQFNDAAMRYYGGGNALAGAAGVGSETNTRAQAKPMNALLGVAGTAPAATTPSAFERAFARAHENNLDRSRARDVQPAQPSEPQPAEPDFSALGEPRDERDAAFLDMLRLDAKRAFEIDSEMRDRAADKLKLQMDGWGYAASRLGGVKDAEGYRAALADIQRRIEPLGVSVADHLPARFPGPERLREIRLSAIDAEGQTRLFLQEANMLADNERADRNTDSMIETRERRAAEYERTNRARESNQRRGQDMTDARVRSGRRPRIVSVKTVAQANALEPGTLYRGPDGQVRER